MEEVVVDAYGEEERAMGWYYYAADNIVFPFKAQCSAKRAASPLKVEQFGAGYQQLAAQGTAWLQLLALNQPVNAEIMNTEHGCGFLDGIRQPFGPGRWLREWCP
jgi:hypothetical protein